MASLIALKISGPGNVYGFGDYITQYQQLVKNYYTSGYNRRHLDLHPPGSGYRPGSYAPVAWNGLNGSQSTVWSPDGLSRNDRRLIPLHPPISAPHTTLIQWSYTLARRKVARTPYPSAHSTTISTQSQARPVYRRVSATAMASSARSKTQTQPPAPSLSPSPRPPAKAQMKTLNLYMCGLRRFPVGYRAGA